LTEAGRRVDEEREGLPAEVLEPLRRLRALPDEAVVRALGRHDMLADDVIDETGSVHQSQPGAPRHMRAPEQPQLTPGMREPGRTLPDGQVREGAAKTSDVRQPALARELEPFERRYDSEGLRAGSDGRDYRPAQS